MSDVNYQCPRCRSTLAAVTNGNFDTWECREGHGIGLTLTEAYGRLQEDEIRAIWAAAKDAPASALKSPVLGHPMVAITVTVDDDELEGNEGPGAHLVTLDVAPGEQFLWFHVVDLESMPTDLPNPQPSKEEVAKLEALRKQSSNAIERDLAARDADDVGYRIGSKAAAMFGLGGLMKRLGARTAAKLK
jgi:hypothetical protein